MFTSLINKTVRNISVVKDFIGIHKKIVDDLSDDETAINFSKIDYKMYIASSCVTRLYAIFENYVESLLSDYLDYISELVKFKDLPNEFKGEYRVGISHILSKIDNARYSHLNHENVVNWYHDALTGKRKYNFVTEALTRHEQNLRLNTIENLFNKIQLNTLRSWLSNNKLIQELYPDGPYTYEQLSSEFSNFIQERNDAAHGSLDNIEGLETLDRYCDLVIAVSLALSSYLNKTLIVNSKNKRFIRIGKVTETFTANGAFIFTSKKGISLQTNSNITFIGEHYCYSLNLDSMQIDGTDIAGITTITNNLEIGMKCSSHISRRAIVYLRNN